MDRKPLMLNTSIAGSPPHPDWLAKPETLKGAGADLRRRELAG